VSHSASFDDWKKELDEGNKYKQHPFKETLDVSECKAIENEGADE
jgi:hypothetical protein